MSPLRGAELLPVNLVVTMIVRADTAAVAEAVADKAAIVAKIAVRATSRDRAAKAASPSKPATIAVNRAAKETLAVSGAGAGVAVGAVIAAKAAVIAVVPGRKVSRAAEQSSRTENPREHVVPPSLKLRAQLAAPFLFSSFNTKL